MDSVIGLLTSFTWKNASYFVNRYNYLQLLLIKQCCIISHKKCTVLYTVDSKDRKQVQYITRHKSIRVFQAICHIFISQIIKGKKVFPYRNDWYFYSASVPSNIFASKCKSYKFLMLFLPDFRRNLLIFIYC